MAPKNRQIHGVFDEVAALHARRFTPSVAPVADPPISQEFADNFGGTGEAEGLPADLHRALEISKLGGRPDKPGDIFSNASNVGLEQVVSNNANLVVLAQINGVGTEGNEAYSVTLTMPKQAVFPQTTKIYAVIEYGAGGLQEQATIDWVWGTVIRVPGNFIRVSAMMYQRGQSDPFDGTSSAKLGAFIARNVTERCTRPVMTIDTGGLVKAGGNITIDFGPNVGGAILITGGGKTVRLPLGHFVDATVQYSPETTPGVLLEYLDTAGNSINARTQGPTTLPMPIHSLVEAFKVTNNDSSHDITQSAQLVIGVEL